MKPERVGLYGRISTADKKQDIELQLVDLRAYAAARGWKVFKEYLDVGVSGSREHRPAFNQLMEDARKRKIDLILVWRLDRFGRSLKHLVVCLDELKILGVGFVSYKESLDFTTPTGRLMFHLLGAFSEFEKELIRERVKAGVAHARAKGKRLGRPREDIDFRKLSELRDSGLTLRAIAKEMGRSLGFVHKSLSKCTLKTPDNSIPKYQQIRVQ